MTVAMEIREPWAKRPRFCWKDTSSTSCGDVLSELLKILGSRYIQISNANAAVPVVGGAVTEAYSVKGTFVPLHQACIAAALVLESMIGFCLKSPILSNFQVLMQHCQRSVCCILCGEVGVCVADTDLHCTCVSPAKLVRTARGGGGTHREMGK